MTALVTRGRLQRLTSFTSIQLVVQAVAFASGIVLVRCMEQTQYGYYTLALSIVGAASVLGDLGLASAMMAFGGRLTGQRRALGQLLVDAQALQRRLAWLSFVVLAPCCAALLLRQQVPIWQTALLTLSVAASAALNVRAGVTLSVTRLLGHAVFQQRLELSINVARLALLMLAAWIALDATLAILVNLAIAVAYLLALQRHVSTELDVVDTATAPATATAAATHTAALRAHLWKQGPNAVYFVASSQIAVWLIGIFGNAERVAEVGALGRLAALFTLIGTVAATFVLPYFARRDEPAELASAFWGVNAFFASLLASLIALATQHPAAVLWVLGRQYAELHNELAWMVSAATLAAWSGIVYSIGCARGWVLPVVVTVSTGVAAMAAAASLVDVASVRGSFMINTAIGAVGTVVASGYVALRLRQHAKLKAAVS